MTDSTPIRKLRRQLLNRHHLAPAPATKALVNPATLPSKYHKTPTQLMLEYKYHILLEDLLSHGSLNDICTSLGNEVDRATISKWRKGFKEQRKKQEEAKFWSQFDQP